MANQQLNYKPFISSETRMTEMTLRGVIIGVFLSIVLGAANAYLGLKAGMTIAATYPAAVIGMAILRSLKGTILEENFTRSIGSVGESVAAGAIFTLPAFYISGIWPEFYTAGHYIISALIMVTGGMLGILFIALIRRVMANDATLPFPESIAAAEIHKTGQTGAGSKYLFWAMGLGGLIKALGEFRLFMPVWEKFVQFKTQFITGAGEAIKAKGGILLGTPGLRPAYIGVGYIIGPRLASLNFSGGVIAWGLLTPIIFYFIGPHIDMQAWAQYLVDQNLAANMNEAMTQVKDPIFRVNETWKAIVRPIAIGGMLVGTFYTLYGMRKSLASGIKRSIQDLKETARGVSTTERVEKDLNFGWIMAGIIAAAVATFLITKFVFYADYTSAIIATVVMIVFGFFFAAVSGYLVGIIGSSSNPISGLTISTVVVTALLLLILGARGESGVATVLAVAAIICVSAAVAGEMLQDLKAGHVLGGTPWRMQIGDLIGLVASAAVMFIPLFILHAGDIETGKQLGYEGGFGSQELPAPQASLMAVLSKGIIAGQMAWALIVVGILMGIGFILMRVQSPMIVAVGMYLPLETTFAIFIGGMIKGILQNYQRKRGFDEKRKNKANNIGLLLASGLIAGEALIGLLFAGLAFGQIEIWRFAHPSFLTSIAIFVVLGLILVRIPMRRSTEADVPESPEG
ncbi:MAG: oligopeptide transporter, OPT family [Bacteroidales bacterium]